MLDEVCKAFCWNRGLAVKASNGKVALRWKSKKRGEPHSRGLSWTEGKGGGRAIGLSSVSRSGWCHESRREA